MGTQPAAFSVWRPDLMGEKGDSAPISRGAEESLNICPVFIFPQDPYLGFGSPQFPSPHSLGHRTPISFLASRMYVSGSPLSLGSLGNQVLA